MPAVATAADDARWYKDAVVYQLHIKAFFDSNDDGMGDFRGLTEKLDYIKDLGVNAIWLLPFYPSPLRDDGYDVADYRNVHPAYGTRADFHQFVREAHRRELRVITELIVNHTSDQHPWFQAARRAPKGSAKRDYYVWSDDPGKYAGTRIIFTDTEKSNWAWDDVAKAFYWHRFFSHQPDLNFDNPQVRKAIFRVMRFWLDMGVDGFRLDAIPYLCEREGTNNENLPETHAVLKELRAMVDAHYPNRLLLAEANQWPEDVREYFGDGDECHMAYHFPLMPRMYMAIAQEDRHPITEIMAQTPDIPENCQWAIFLRNHDELTLEMVTSKERDYMYQMYATDPRARVNVGIRRRLAPLLENDTGRIKLMTSLLLSMPGSPILYYGDEIGMGDNIYLGDRDGVRTPMQWRPERNAGFSRADPQRLYLQPIMDAIYGYEAVNVEAQLREPASLLNWTRRMLAVRKGFRAFGRGRLTFLRPGNRKILAYLREYGDEIILCVANLARSAQPVELDLVRYKGRVPVELMGRTAFPPIGDLPYLLTLAGHGFLWFRLAAGEDVPAWHEERLPREELPMLVLFDGWASLFRDRVVPWRIAMSEKVRAQLEREALPAFVAGRRWYAAKGVPVGAVTLVDHVEWERGEQSWLVALARVERDKGEAETLFPPADARVGRRGRGQAAHARAAHGRQGAAAGASRGPRRRLRRRRVLSRARRGDRRRRAAEVGARHAAVQAVARLRRNRGRRLRSAARRRTGRAEQQHDRCAGRAPVPQGLSALADRAQSRSRNRSLSYRRRALSGEHPGGGQRRIRRRGRPQDDARPAASLCREPGRRVGIHAQLSGPRASSSRRRRPNRREPASTCTAATSRSFARSASAPPSCTPHSHERPGTPRSTPSPSCPRMLPPGHSACTRMLTWRSTVSSGGAQRYRKGCGRARAALSRDARRSSPGSTRMAQTARPAPRRACTATFTWGRCCWYRTISSSRTSKGEPSRTFAERAQKQSPLKDVAGMLRSFDYAMHAALARVGPERAEAQPLLDDRRPRMADANARAVPRRVRRGRAGERARVGAR